MRVSRHLCEGGDRLRGSFNEKLLYKALLQVNNAIVTQTTSAGLFKSLSQSIQKIINYDRFSICIYEAESDTLTWFAVAEGVAVEGLDDSARPLEKGSVARSVIKSGVPIIIRDMGEYEHWPSIKLMMDKGLRSTMAFPLIARGTILGTLHLSFKTVPDDIDSLARFLTELSAQVAIAVDNMLAHTKLMNINASLKQQNQYLIDSGCSDYHGRFFHYSNPAMKRIIEQVETIANSDASVLITGETGTGKDYLANFIHSRSNRRDALFVKINCPALAESLFESELFGHAKGAFTGANAKRVGRFEMANGGTIFLDEIGELSPTLQAKLLHVIQDKKFERVGESRAISADFRVIAATNADLEKAIQEKSFRSDLYYRLNTVSFHMPPLRERVDEIEQLVHQMTRMYVAAMRCDPPQYADDVFLALMRYPWPGNIRELKNIVNRMVIAYHGKRVSARDIEPFLNLRREQGLPQSLATLDDVEREHLVKVLTLTKGVVGGSKGAAKLLQIPKSTLQYKLRKHRLRPTDFSN